MKQHPSLKFARFPQGRVDERYKGAGNLNGTCELGIPGRTEGGKSIGRQEVGVRQRPKEAGQYESGENPEFTECHKSRKACDILKEGGRKKSRGMENIKTPPNNAK